MEKLNGRFDDRFAYADSFVYRRCARAKIFQLLAENVNLYQLIGTQKTANSEDDQIILPDSVSYDAAGVVSERDIKDAIETATGLRELVVGWLSDQYPRFM